MNTKQKEHFDAVHTKLTDGRPFIIASDQLIELVACLAS